MAQTFEYTWINPGTVQPVTVNVGFNVTRVNVYDTTAGKMYTWVNQMTPGEYMVVGTAGVITSNGFTPSAQTALFGAPITGIEIASPTVFYADYISQFGFQIGDTVLATDIADGGPGKTLNGLYTVSSLAPGTVTCSENTGSGYRGYNRHRIP